MIGGEGRQAWVTCPYGLDCPTLGPLYSPLVNVGVLGRPGPSTFGSVQLVQVVHGFSVGEDVGLSNS